MRTFDTQSVFFICIAAVMITSIIVTGQCEREKQRLQFGQRVEEKK